MPPDGHEARYTSAVSPDTLNKEGITELYFFKNTEKKHYTIMEKIIVFKVGYQ